MINSSPVSFLDDIGDALHHSDALLERPASESGDKGNAAGRVSSQPADILSTDDAIIHSI